ncbi:hypothetical protein QCA50_010075 [Cerrena zonata]|uniref:C2 domain-containing protein n=1 Tax=Cerrena zonata TaxID=2478898 RepID=A0AAW0G550_9APHY
MDDLDSPDPWYLTIVRTQGIAFIRPEKSWRPIVSVTIGGQHTHEIILGCDGQNPNLKTPFPLRDIDGSSYLDIKVFHKSHSKNRRKRHLIGSAYVTIGDVLRRQSRPGCDLDLRLSCPPPQKRSPTVSGARQLNTATLTIRLRPPTPLLSSRSSITAVDSPLLSQDEDGIFSDDTSDHTLPSSPVTEQPPKDSLPMEIETDQGSNHLRRRKRPKPYCINTTDEGSSSDSSCYPPSPIDTQPDFCPAVYGNESMVCEDITPSASCSVLPQYQQDPVVRPLSFVERFVNRFAPYEELCRAEEDSQIEKILGKQLTEWYVVGGSLLAVAGLNAAVFGFSSDTIFSIDGIAKRSIAIGSIAAGIGIVVDAWFLVAYSSADAAKFTRLARDVYNSYFFFCLTCRLPALCMFVSACALMVFLFTVAWETWPTAVLVMSFAAGILVSLQYLVFGVHRFVNLVNWTVRSIWSKLVRRAPPPVCPPEIQMGQTVQGTN